MDYKDDPRGYELQWDDTIENDGSDYEPLPEGEYDFRVIAYERGRHTPGADGKIPSCNKAVLEIAVSGEGRDVIVKSSLLLHSKMEWKLCEFFTSVGLRKKGEPLRMNWNAVAGARGRCKVRIREWTNDKGQKRTSNEVIRFLEPDGAQPSGRFTEGVF